MLRRLALALAALLGLVVVAALIFAATMDVDRLRPWISEQARAATGRELALEGELRLGWLPPRLVVNDVRFGNAAWGSRPDMATIESLELGVALAPLLLERRIVVERLRLRGVDLLLERDPGARGPRAAGNWELGPPAPEASGDGAGARPPHGDATGPAPEPAPESSASGEAAGATMPELRDVELERVRVSFRGEGEAGSQRLDVASLTLAPRDDRLALALRARWNDAELSGEGSLGLLSGLDGSAGAWPISLRLRVAGAAISIEGVLANPLRLAGPALALSAQGDDLDGLAQLTGAALPAGRPWSLALRVDEPAPHRIAIGDLVLRLGGSALDGSARVALGERPRIEATLDASTLDLADLAPGRAPREPHASAHGSGGGRAAGGRLFSDAALDLSALDRIDAEVALAVERLVAQKLAVSGVDAWLGLAAGRLAVELRRAALADGNASGSLQLAARDGALSARVALEDVSLGRALAELGVSDVLRGGATDVHLELNGRGASLHEIASSLSGSVVADVSEGVVSSRALDAVRGDLLDLLKPILAPGGDTTLRCAVARFDLSDGIARSRVIAVDGTHVVTTGGGQIDLGRETMDLRLRSKVMDSRIGDAVIPIEVSGSLSGPRVEASAAAAIGSLARTELGAKLREKTGIDLGALAPGDDPAAIGLSCSDARAIAAGHAKARPAPARSGAPGSDAVRSLREGLKGIFGR